MTSETKTEIVIFGGIAAIAAVFWYLHRSANVAAGNGTQLPSIGDVGGNVYNNSLPAVAAEPPWRGNGAGPYGSTFNVNPMGIPGVSSCNTCTDVGGSGLMFGSTADMASFLSAGDYLQQIAAGLKEGWS